MVEETDGNRLTEVHEENCRYNGDGDVIIVHVVSHITLALT